MKKIILMFFIVSCVDTKTSTIDHQTSIALFSNFNIRQKFDFAADCFLPSRTEVNFSNCLVLDVENRSISFISLPENACFWVQDRRSRWHSVDSYFFVSENDTIENLAKDFCRFESNAHTDDPTKLFIIFEKLQIQKPRFLLPYSRSRVALVLCMSFMGHKLMFPEYVYNNNNMNNYPHNINLIRRLRLDYIREGQKFSLEMEIPDSVRLIDELK